MEHSPELEVRDVQLLRIGRHFRLDTGEKVIVGRNQDENEKLLSMKDDADIVLDVKDYPSPIALTPHGASEEAIAKAASICVRYSDAPRNEKVTVTYHRGGKTHTFSTEASLDEELHRIRI